MEAGKMTHKRDNNEAAASVTAVTVARKKVQEALGFFRQTYRDEEAKNMKGQSRTSSYTRTDLITYKIVKAKNKQVNTGKQILGVVPGIEVGDEFHFRVELAIIGLHRQIQGGIDYLKKDNNDRIVATSIVASGRGYTNDMGRSDVLTYSGQGGKAEDQKLEKGNLSLVHSMEDRSPVRVIRGFKEPKESSNDKKAKTVATYIYDGLYSVEKYWREKGSAGNIVFMFQLRRIPGQPELAMEEVKKHKKPRVSRANCVVEDISHGEERMRICAVNAIDNEKPPSFKYITNVIYPSCSDVTPSMGCECINGCSDDVECLCTLKNGGEVPFNDNGQILQAKPLVHECGPCCKCPPSCPNRVSQLGIKFPLEIFKTELRGWGVRSLTSIPSGSFICEYTGKVLADKEAEQRTGSDEYLFDIGEKDSFTINAEDYGNVGRFINHSCSPNLIAQDVLYDHDDKRMPHIMFFAADDIPRLQELTYDYNYVLGQVCDADGNTKTKDCYCGSIECTGRMY